MSDSALAVIGSIDKPDGSAALPPGELAVVGWAFGAKSPVCRIEITRDGEFLGRANLYRSRPDIAAFFNRPATELAGFEFRTELRAEAGAALSFRLGARVVLLDGHCEELPAIAVTLAPARAQPEPLPAVAPPPPAPVPSREAKIRVLCFARTLDHGGSQLRMNEFLQHLQTGGRFAATVIAPADGPLRAALEASGIAVRITPMPFGDAAAYHGEVARCAAWAADRFDVVLAFTLTSFFGIDVATHLGLPSVWRLGENEPVARVLAWSDISMDRAVALQAEAAFSAATAVVCISDDTRRVHRRDSVADRFVVVRNGVAIADAERSLRTHDRAACRQRLGIEHDARLLVCAGTRWPIKGQALLLDALAHVGDTHPALQCALIGASVEPYDSSLRRLVARSGLSGRVRFVDFATDLEPWWRAADVVACPSESEALSTSVLEGMARGLPALAARVGGMPEVVAEGETGWLAEANDLGAWIAALSRVGAADPAELRRLGAFAKARMVSDYDRTDTFASLGGILERVARREPLPSPASGG